MNKQTRIRKQERNSQAYRAGYSDYLSCSDVVVHGRLNVSPAYARRKEWLCQYPLYEKGWIAARRSA